jgi:hypothetical protein
MIVLLAIIVSLGVYIMFLHKLIKRAGVELLQALADRETMAIYMEGEMAKSNASALNDNDGFVKFLSESREWAFKYIEDVQETLDKFVGTVGPIMEYYDKYGRVVETPHTRSLDQIHEAYQGLIKILPEENKTTQGETNE